VFRAAALLIVLTLAVGQNAALLCSVRCGPHEAAITGCHHEEQATFPSVTGNDYCNHVALDGSAFVREDVRRCTSAPDAPHTVAVPVFQLTPPSADIRPGHETGQQSLLEARPLFTPLRI
jgi:hypothetical protein